MDQPLADGRAERWRETVVVVVLSLTAILTAWSGFEASQWGGETSIGFSKASAARIEASRASAQADAAKQVDLSVFALYVQAVAQHDDTLATFAEERFTDRFRPAFDEWLATKPLQNPDAPKTPFELDSYVPPGQQEAAAADARADALFQQALRDDDRGDRYTALTVLFALVLFFAAFSSRFVSRRASWVMLGGSVALLAVGVAFLVAYPKLV